MNNLFKQLFQNISTDVKKNGFDLSARDVFSSKVGYKLPVVALETVPKDYFEITPQVFFRTNNMQSANFVRLKQTLDFYFVPYVAISREFNSWIQQTKDPSSVLFQEMSTSANPVPKIQLVILLLGILYTHYEFTSAATLSISEYLRFDDLENSQFVDAVVQRAGHPDVVSTTRVVNAINYGVSLFTKIDSNNQRVLAVDKVGEPIYLGTLRLLDMLGYGNYLPLIKLPLTEDYEIANKINLEVFIGDLMLDDVFINLFRLAAYQCVCQNYDLNTTYDKLDPSAYSMDDLYLADNEGEFYEDTRYRSSSIKSDDIIPANSPFVMNYAPWKKDIFISAFPDSQFGSVSVVSLSGVRNNYLDLSGTYKFRFVDNDESSASTSNSYGLYIGSSGSSSEGVVSRSTVLASSSNPTVGKSLQILSRDGGWTNILFEPGFNVLDLRRAEALQGWKEDMLRAGFRARSRQSSQFGVAPRYDAHFVPIPISSFDESWRKDVVKGTSMDNFAEEASTASSMLEGRTFKFSTDDYGVIIGILTIRPEAEYNSFGIDPHNTKFEPFDFFTPAFQNLGLQPLHSRHVNIFNRGVGSVFGYVPRYSEYKQRVDKVHGEFMHVPESFSGDTAIPGQKYFYVATRHDLENEQYNLSNYYIDPSIVDDIFVASANGFQETDQFDINFYCSVRASRPMSVLGLPRY